MGLVWAGILFIQVVCPPAPIPSLSRPGSTGTQLPLETEGGWGGKDKGKGSERKGCQRRGHV